MKKILSSVFLTFVLFMSFIVFFPKQKLYYLLQERVLPYSVRVEAGSVTPSAFSLDLQNISILLADSKVAHAKSAHLSLLGMELNDIKTAGMLADGLPDIKKVAITFGVGAKGVITGEFGKVLANLDIFKRKIVVEAKININVKNRYKMIFSQFKKVGDKYVYKYSF